MVSDKKTYNIAFSSDPDPKNKYLKNKIICSVDIFLFIWVGFFSKKSQNVTCAIFADKILDFVFIDIDLALILPDLYSLYVSL
jgi:hypothetical protein